MFRTRLQPILSNLFVLSALVFSLEIRGAVAMAQVLTQSAKNQMEAPPAHPSELLPAHPQVTKTILVIGDSIAEGFGVRKDQAFPERMAQILRGDGYAVKIINGGISGSVTAEADRRLKWYLKAKPDLLLLELGGNDGLKGTPIPVIKANLLKVIELAQQKQILVVLTGMRIYSSYGSGYAKQFQSMYEELAKEKKLKFFPFLLQGVALQPQLNQADHKHPNAEGHNIIARHLAQFLEPLL